MLTRSVFSLDVKLMHVMFYQCSDRLLGHELLMNFVRPHHYLQIGVNLDQGFSYMICLKYFMFILEVILVLFCNT